LLRRQDLHRPLSKTTQTVVDTAARGKHVGVAADLQLSEHINRWNIRACIVRTILWRSITTRCVYKGIRGRGENTCKPRIKLRMVLENSSDLVAHLPVLDRHVRRAKVETLPIVEGDKVIVPHDVAHHRQRSFDLTSLGRGEERPDLVEREHRLG